MNPMAIASMSLYRSQTGYVGFLFCGWVRPHGGLSGANADPRVIEAIAGLFSGSHVRPADLHG